MDAKLIRTAEEMKRLQDEAVQRALEISELEAQDDYELKLCFSIFFLPLPGMDRAADARYKKLTRIEHFRQWLKANNLTPRDCGIGSGFVKTHLPEYGFLY